MNLYLLSMRDVKASIYMQPYASHNLASTYRDLQDILSSGSRDLPWMKYPQDFELYQVGIFNDETGEITPCQPKFLKHLAQLKDTAE